MQPGGFFVFHFNLYQYRFDPKLPALAGLCRAFKDQLCESAYRDEARILQVSIGKLHGEAIFNFSDEFHHFHGG